MPNRVDAPRLPIVTSGSTPSTSSASAATANPPAAGSGVSAPAPRTKGWLSGLGARARAKLPKVSATEITTLLSAHKRAGKPLNTLADAGPLRENASLPDSATAKRADRAKRTTDKLMQQAAQNLKLRGGSADTATAPSARPTVPTDAAAFRAAVAALFTTGIGAAEELQAKLEQIGAHDDRDVPAADRYVGALLVATALAQSCRRDATDALEVLAQMENRLRLDGSEDAAGEIPTGGDSEASTSHAAAPTRRPTLQRLFDQEKREAAPPLDHHAAAWRSAQLLARSPAGFDTLCSLMRSPPRPEQARTAKALLQAADHLHRGGADGSPIPAELLRQHAANGSKAPLAAKVLHAATAKLGGKSLSADAAGALFAWHQGFREDGPDSDLAKTKGRLHKFVSRSIPRVRNKGMSAKMWQMAGKKKSPLSAASLGMHGAHRAAIVKESGSHGQSLAKLAGLVLSHEPPAAELLPTLTTPAHMWRAAILKYWAERPADAPLSSFTLTPQTLAALRPQAKEWAADTLLELDGTTADASAEQVASRFGELARQAGLTTDSDHAVPAELIGLRPDSALLAQWAESTGELTQSEPFRQALKAATEIEQPDDKALQGVSMEDARKAIEGLLLSIEGGNKLRLANGGIASVGTQGVTTNLSKVGQALPVPVSASLDAQLSHSRQAVVEISRNAHGRDIFVGTERGTRGSLGAGAKVGYDIKVPWIGTRLRASAGANVTPIDYEKSEPRGVVIRAPRQPTAPVGGHDDWEAVKYDDKATEKALVDVSNLLFDQAKRHFAEVLRPDQLWNTLAAHCGDSEAISVGWVDQVKRRTRQAAKVNGGVDVRLSSQHEPVRLGPNLQVMVENTSSATASARESSGAMHMEQFSVGHDRKTSLRASVGLSVGKDFPYGKVQTSSTGVQTHAHGVTQNFAGFTPLGYMAQFTESGRNTKARLFYQNGRLNDRVCYFDTEYRSAKEYLAVIRSERDAWIDMLSRRPGATPESARKEFDEYCATVEKYAQPNQRYLHRLRLRPAVARQIERNLALADMYRGLSPQSEQAQAAEAEAKALLHAPESRLPEKLAIIEQSSTRTMFGPATALQMQATTEAEGQRELAQVRFG